MSRFFDKSKNMAKRLKEDTKTSMKSINFDEANDKFTNLLNSSSQTLKSKLKSNDKKPTNAGGNDTSRSSSVTSISSLSSSSIMETFQNIKNSTSRISLKKQQATKPRVNRSKKNGAGLTTITSMDSNYDYNASTNDFDAEYSDVEDESGFESSFDHRGRGIHARRCARDDYDRDDDASHLSDFEFIGTDDHRALRVTNQPYRSSGQAQQNNVFDTPLSDVFSDTYAV